MGAIRGDWAERLKLSFGFAMLLTGLAAGSATAAALDPSACRKAQPAAFSEGLAIPPRAMTIVAVGSSSTEGTARNERSKVYPAALEQALSRAWPNVTVTVANRGKGGETMKQTLQRFESDVLALKPSLVIWQLGVNDVLRYRGIEGRREEIREGLKVLAERGVPVVLLDLQYAPAVTADPDTIPCRSLSTRPCAKGRGRSIISGVSQRCATWPRPKRCRPRR